ncbi:hypothetical protein BDV93DRAFT_542238 [Ceratobasidium sp. AG-I]|nr:hypothetical protein BDV93DRAFT_542238 [Ceratobasidium sp. AG-I]
MGSVAIIGACLVPCFISIANPWFYTTSCGQGGCPMCHKAAHRGRAGVEASAMELNDQARQAASEIPTRARGMFSRQELAEEKDGGQEKKGWLRRGCGWEEKNMEARGEQHEGAAEMRETTREDVIETQVQDSTRVASHSEQYRGTPPMRIPHIDVQDQEGSPATGQAGVSFGVDVSHLAPEPLPFGATPEERLIEENARPAESAEGKQVRPSLDEAISWDRLAGTSKPGSKRKWWHMP